jgi:hypothetical protein
MPRQSVHHQACCPSMDRARATARHSRTQANQCRVADVAPTVHRRYARKGRIDERYDAIDSAEFRRHRRLDSDRQADRFIELINGLFQAAKRRAPRTPCFETRRMARFLIAGKHDIALSNESPRSATVPTSFSKKLQTSTFGMVSRGTTGTCIVPSMTGR